MNMIIFIGIPASGKSEFYKRRFYDTHVRVNLDMLKTRNRESILINACFAAKQPFVVDNTNVTKESRGKYINAAKERDFEIVGYYFNSSIEASITRNEKRAGKKRIPVEAILSASKKLELPSTTEGFNKLYYVYIQNDEFFVEDYIDL